MPKTVTSTCGIPLRTLNLYILRKQFLLPESAATDVMQVTEHLLGLHAKRPQTPYLMLQARLPDFSAQHLDDLLYQQRAYFFRIRLRRRVHIVHHRRLRRRYRDAGNGLGQAFARRPHQLGMEGRTHR